VSFMGSVSTERRSQGAAASTFEARQAYESAVNLVISQIREATTDGGMAWASQPGLVRTFDQNGNRDVFKLYSSATMRMTDSAYDPTKAEESGYVSGTPNIDPPGYVNLNDPIFVPSKTVKDAVEPHYPIPVLMRV